MKRDEIERQFIALAPRVALIAMRKYRLSADETVEALQHAYLRLRGRLDDDEESLDSTMHLKLYMLGAVRSHVFHARERSRTRERNEAALWHAVAPSPPLDPEAELIAKEDSARLWTAIGRLKEPYRSIFNLLVGKEMALSEIAAEVGVSKASIYQQYARGLQHLRKILVTASDDAPPGGITD